MNKGQKPMLPLWLSPTQIRFIPVGDEFISDCEGFIEELNNLSGHLIIRSDLDDREQSVGRKIRDAEKEWVPIIIVVGEKERTTKKFNPRFRKESIGDENRQYSIKDLKDLMSKLLLGYPNEPLPLKVHMSKRPKFK